MDQYRSATATFATIDGLLARPQYLPSPIPEALLICSSLKFAENVGERETWLKLFNSPTATNVCSWDRVFATLMFVYRCLIPTRECSKIRITTILRIAFHKTSIHRRDTIESHFGWLCLQIKKNCSVDSIIDYPFALALFIAEICSRTTSRIRQDSYSTVRVDAEWKGRSSISLGTPNFPTLMPACRKSIQPPFRQPLCAI